MLYLISCIVSHFAQGYVCNRANGPFCLISTYTVLNPSGWIFAVEVSASNVYAIVPPCRYGRRSVVAYANLLEKKQTKGCHCKWPDRIFENTAVQLN
jgi:hypothetical protein